MQVGFKEIADAGKLEEKIKTVAGVTAVALDAKTRRAKITLEDTKLPCDSIVAALRKDGIACQSIDPIRVTLKVTGPKSDEDWKTVLEALTAELGVSNVTKVGDDQIRLCATASLADLEALKKTVAKAGDSKKFEAEAVSHDVFACDVKNAKAISKGLDEMFGVVRVTADGTKVTAIYERDLMTADALKAAVASLDR